MDLYPTALFRQDNNGKSPIACGLPEVSIQRINGAVVTGVLIYAQHWNPPPGWLRISASEDFTCTRLSTMCDSDNAIYTGELDDAWKSEVTNNKSLGTRVSDKKGAAKNKVDLQIPNELFANKATNVLKDIHAVTTIMDMFTAKQAQQQASKDAAISISPDGDASDAPPHSCMIGSTSMEPTPTAQPADPHHACMDVDVTAPSATTANAYGLAATGARAATRKAGTADAPR